MEEIIIIFVEGHGEKVFFEKLIKKIDNITQKKIKEYEIENMKAIGNYKNKALRIYKNRYKKKYSERKRIILFNYDTDVFKNKPYPINWEEVKKSFTQEDSSCEIYHLKVEENLEDILLLDLDGLMNFLEIEEHEKETAKDMIKTLETGSEKIKLLYKIGRNVYTKNGKELEKLMETFDMDKVIQADLECINILIEKITCK